MIYIKLKKLIIILQGNNEDEPINIETRKNEDIQTFLHKHFIAEVEQNTKETVDKSNLLKENIKTTMDGKYIKLFF